MKLAIAITTAEFLLLGVEALEWTTKHPKAMVRMAANLNLMAYELRRTQL